MQEDDTVPARECHVRLLLRPLLLRGHQVRRRIPHLRFVVLLSPPVNLFADCLQSFLTFFCANTLQQVDDTEIYPIHLYSFFCVCMSVYVFVSSFICSSFSSLPPPLPVPCPNTFHPFECHQEISVGLSRSHAF